jgi:hypothetical protein
LFEILRASAKWQATLWVVSLVIGSFYQLEQRLVLGAVIRKRSQIFRSWALSTSGLHWKKLARKRRNESLLKTDLTGENDGK